MTFSTGTLSDTTQCVDSSTPGFRFTRRFLNRRSVRRFRIRPRWLRSTRRGALTQHRRTAAADVPRSDRRSERRFVLCCEQRRMAGGVDGSASIGIRISCGARGCANVRDADCRAASPPPDRHGVVSRYALRYPLSTASRGVGALALLSHCHDRWVSGGIPGEDPQCSDCCT